jgi:CheY-like chemotaxis protein
MMARILVIDDNPDCADMLAELLQMHGHILQQAYGGLQGMAVLRSFKPTVVFLDLGMPVCDGFEIAAMIRREHSVRCPYIIAFSAWSDSATVEKCRLAGFNQHLTKTSPLEEIVASVKAVTDLDYDE